MLIAAFIFVISVAATIQFAMSSWRAGLMHTTSQVVIREPYLLNAKGFKEVVAYEDVCPDLARDPGASLGGVRLYYAFLEALRQLGVSSWTTSEMALCTRYATVVLSQRFERNQILLADVRSY